MMRIILCAVAVVLLSHASWAGDDKAAAASCHLELVDGSRLVGTLVEPSLTFVTAVGEVKLPADGIRSIGFNDDRETSEVTMFNGDRLSGVVKLRTLDLDTLLGRIQVPLSECRNLAAAAGSIEEGLCLYYSFDKNNGDKALDESGNNRHSKVNGATWTPAGISGGGMSFDGKDDYLETLAGIDISGGQARTVSFWIDFNMTGDGPWLLGWGGQNGQKYSINLSHPGIFACGMEACSAVAGFVDKDDDWHHLCLVQNTNTAESIDLYVDGKPLPKDDRSRPGVVNTGNTPLRIGHAFNQSGYFYYGIMDEVRIYRRALRPEEVRQLYGHK